MTPYVYWGSRRVLNGRGALTRAGFTHIMPSLHDILCHTIGQLGTQLTQFLKPLHGLPAVEYRRQWIMFEKPRVQLPDTGPLVKSFKKHVVDPRHFAANCDARQNLAPLCESILRSRIAQRVRRTHYSNESQLIDTRTHFPPFYDRSLSIQDNRRVTTRQSPKLNNQRP
jgi:hypothetical protein